jgi:hypothetical protein
MRAYGYGDWDWEAQGFVAGLPRNFVPFPTVEPVILNRTGTFATFGPSQIGDFAIPCEFIWSSGGGFAGMEEAFIYLFKRLNPYNTAPRQLRVQRLDGTKLAVPAVIRLSSRAASDINSRFIDFVAVEPFSALTASTASGSFA